MTSMIVFQSFKAQAFGLTTSYSLWLIKDIPFNGTVLEQVRGVSHELDSLFLLNLNFFVRVRCSEIFYSSLI